MAFKYGRSMSALVNANARKSELTNQGPKDGQWAARPLRGASKLLGRLENNDRRNLSVGI